MTSSTQTYAYLRPSAVHELSAGRGLTLEASGGATPVGAVANPRFFSGFLTSPVPSATALLAVVDVAAARYFLPRASSLDPVVTANGDRLRFESFSGCCGVYARLDVLAPGLDGGEVGHGTTNVDVNPPLRRALARLGGADPLHLAVGPEEVEVGTVDGRFVEKKVPLPERWVRGFAEAQVLAAGFEVRAEVPASAAEDLLRALPKSAGARATRWVVPTGKALRPVARAASGAVCLPSPERLLAVRQVLRHATAVRVYAPVDAGTDVAAVVWEVVLPGMRLTLLLSQDASRGFSGEGGVLVDLAGVSVAEDAELVSVLLAWEPRVDVAELARQSDLPPERVRAALTVLGTGGQVGYDLAEEAYFHRSLPYSAGRVENRNPRLKGARALVAEGAVRLDGVLVSVGSGDQMQTVRMDEAGRLSCTCLWWAKYRGGRGPCKHALAVRIVRDQTTEVAR